MIKRKLIKLGNIYGDRFTGMSYAGNVWDVNGLCPALKNMSSGGGQQPMIIEDQTRRERNLVYLGFIEKETG